MAELRSAFSRTRNKAGREGGLLFNRNRVFVGEGENVLGIDSGSQHCEHI